MERNVECDRMIRCQSKEKLGDITIYKGVEFLALVAENMTLPTDVVLAKEGDFALVKRDNSLGYVVKPLDTITRIAKEFNISEKEIIDKNHLKSTKLYIGQYLKI